MENPIPPRSPFEDLELPLRVLARVMSGIVILLLVILPALYVLHAAGIELPIR